MRVVLTVLLLSAALWAGCVGTPDLPSGPPLPVETPGPVARLARAVEVDATRWSGEPSILALDDGTLLITGAGGMTRYAEDPADAPGNAGQSYVWRSADGGANWTFVDLEAGPGDPLLPYRSGVFGVEGDLATDGQGAAYLVDLTMLATQGVAVSLDGGATWANAGSPVAGLLPGTDRPWVAADSADGSLRSVVVKYLQLAGEHRLAYLQGAADGRALVMVEDRAIPPCGQTPIAVERTGPGATDARIVMACVAGGPGGSGLSVLRAPAYFGPAGVDFPVESLPGPKGEPGGTIGAVLAAGAAGTPMETVYALAWEDAAGGSAAIHLSVSADDGATWSEPLRLNPDNTTAVFPWLDLSPDGRLAVVWYETPGAGDPDTIDGSWVAVHAALGVGPNATLSAPARTVLSGHPVHEGAICTEGLNCVLSGRAEERRLLDFFEVDVDAAGTSHVTWTDNSGEFPTIWYGQVSATT